MAVKFALGQQLLRAIPVLIHQLLVIHVTPGKTLFPLINWVMMKKIFL